MTRDIALLLSDVDGTLITRSHELTAETVSAVRDLRDAGIRFALTSSRPPRGLCQFVEPLAIDTMLGAFNGGLCVRPDMTPVVEHAIPLPVARDALALLAAHGLDAWVFAGQDWLVRDRDGPHVAREIHAVRFEPVVVPTFTDDHLLHACKIVGVSDDHNQVEAAERAAQAALGHRASALRSQAYYLDITHPDANKGAVVRLLSRELGIPADRIATIGDSQNDVAMFREAGFSVAMGNGSDDVKRQASAVTAGNDENGFARAVRDHILGRA